MSKGRLYLLWVIVLLLLTLLFGQIEKQLTEPNQHPQSQISTNGIRQVVLLPNRYHHYIANGFINDQPVTFMVDTGATKVVIPEKIAKRLGLKFGAAIYAETANGDVLVYATRLQNLRLGAIELKDLPAVINPQMADDMILLGMSALKRLDIIQKGNQLTLIQYANNKP